jgi:hypothetical protein
VLWTYWAFAGAALPFPLQHWLARHLATDGAPGVRAAAARVAAGVTAVALASGLAAWVVREQLFGRTDAWFPVLVGLVALGSALMGVVRGVAAGHGRFRVVAVSLVAENALRALIAVGLLVAGVDDPVAFGLALAAGPAVAAFWWRPWRGDSGEGVPPGAPSAGATSGLTSSAAAQLVAQTVLTGAPVLLALSGGSPAAVTSLFAVLALFRAPYLVALGAVPQLTVAAARRTAGGRRPLPVTASAVGAGALGVALLVGVAAGVAARVGPPAVRAVFGPTVLVSSGAAAAVAAGCALAVVNLLLTVLALAQDRAAGALAAWGAAVAVAAAAAAALSLSSPTELALGSFLAAEAAAVVALAVASLRPGQRGGL